MEQQLLLQVSNEAAMESTPSSNNKQDLKVQVERSGIKEIDEGLYWPLSGKPYADMIITKTAVNPIYYMYLPKKLSKELPPDGAPAVLNYGRKSWDVFFCGSNSNSRFSPSEWKRFADDNNLKVGDGLALELSECSTSKIHFKVMILRVLYFNGFETLGYFSQEFTSMSPVLVFLIIFLHFLHGQRHFRMFAHAVKPLDRT